MPSSPTSDVKQLAVRLMDRQAQPETPRRFSFRKRWRDFRYKRALASTPLDALLVALTEERNRREVIKSA